MGRLSKVEKFRCTSYNFSKLSNYVRQFGILSCLTHLAKLSRKMFSDDWDFLEKPHPDYPEVNEKITQWALLYISMVVILVTDEYKILSFQEKELIKSVNYFNGMIDPFTQDKNLIEYFFRISEEQFKMQRLTILNTWSRYISIYQKDIFFTLEFETVVGLTLNDYLMLGLSVFALALDDKRSPIFEMKQLFEINTSIPFLKDILTQEKLEKFFEYNSANYIKIKQLYRERNKNAPKNVERYYFNPLVNFPIVQIKKGKYLVPNTLILLKRLSQGSYWDLRINFDKNKSQDFLNKFGECFEDYVKDLLEQYFGASNIKPVDTLIKWGDRKHADLIYNEGENCYIFEVKSKLFAAQEKYNMSKLDVWLDDLKDSVRQLENTELIIKKEEVFKAKNYYKFIITLEDLPIGEFPEFKKEKILANVFNRNFNSHKTTIEPEINNKTDYEVKNLYLLPINELEFLESFFTIHTFEELINMKIRVDEENNPQIGRYFLKIARLIDENIVFSNKKLEKIHGEVLSKFKL